MATYTIKAQMSGTGSIYDLAGDTDLVLDFSGKREYAVVLPAYFGIAPKYFSNVNLAGDYVDNHRDYAGLRVYTRDGDQVDIVSDGDGGYNDYTLALGAL